MMFLPHFDVFCDLLLNRRTATWNLFATGIKRIILDLRDVIADSKKVVLFEYEMLLLS